MKTLPGPPAPPFPFAAGVVLPAAPAPPPPPVLSCPLPPAGPDLQALYEKRFSEAMVGLKMLGEAKETTDEYRTGQVIRPKQ